jgi:hypothetical protein
MGGACRRQETKSLEMPSPRCEDNTLADTASQPQCSCQVSLKAKWRWRPSGFTKSRNIFDWLKEQHSSWETLDLRFRYSGNWRRVVWQWGINISEKQPVWIFSTLQPSTLKTGKTGSYDKLAPIYQTTRSRILEVFYPACGDNKLLRNIAIYQTLRRHTTYHNRVLLTLTAVWTSDLNKVAYWDWKDILPYRSQRHLLHALYVLSKRWIKWTHSSERKLLKYKKR